METIIQRELLVMFYTGILVLIVFSCTILLFMVPAAMPERFGRFNVLHRLLHRLKLNPTKRIQLLADWLFISRDLMLMLSMCIMSGALVFLVLATTETKVDAQSLDRRVSIQEGQSALNQTAIADIKTRVEADEKRIAELEKQLFYWNGGVAALGGLAGIVLLVRKAIGNELRGELRRELERDREREDT